MDRQELAERNRRVARDLHQATTKQRLRDRLLRAAARMPIKPSGAGSQRLLVIKPDHLGDVLLATPAIQSIKASSPETSIHALCGSWAAGALANYAEIERVLTLDFPGFQRGAAGSGAWRLALQTARYLRNIGYESAIIMRPDHWWGALVAYLAGIERRVGYALDPVAPFLTEAYPYEYRHAVEQNMRLAESWTGEISAEAIRLRFPVAAADRATVNEGLRAWGQADGRARICIHPGAGMPSKLWRPEKWAKLADMLAARFDAAIIFTGTASEEALIGEIRQRMTNEQSIAAGPTSIGQLAALYDISAAVLGPDSGAMHLAAAVGTPTVALFGPADPLEFAPWGDKRRQRVVTAEINCRPCRILDWLGDEARFHPCVADISVAQVMEAAEQVLRADAEPAIAAT